LKGDPKTNAARHWLAEMRDQSAILSGTMVIMHPDMYATGREAMIQLRKWAEHEKQGDILSALHTWPSVYCITSVMVNWSCPVHLDAHGRPQWLDLLVTVGEYEEVDMVLPSLGLRLHYSPGSVVAMSSQLLQHGVGSVKGNHGVVSFYMRDNVHEHANIVCCDPMDI
ncbi:hypothetical protein OG21DRAFT_1421191, partial [Imleria badia]